MFRQMISDAAGNVSSKRGMMVWFGLLFTSTAIINITTGKKLDHDIQMQLFELLVVLIGVVFGEPFMDFLMMVRGQKTTATTTTVAPKDATVVTTETIKSNT